MQRIDVTFLNVELARQCVQHQRFDVLRDAEIEPVNVGELLPSLVNLPEVGVAFHHDAGHATRVRFSDHPGIQRRLLDVAPTGRDFNVTTFAAEQACPIGLVGCLGLRGHVGVVLGVKLAAIVFGEQRGVLSQRCGQLLQEHCVRCGKGELHRAVIYFDNLRWFVGDDQRGGNGFIQLRVFRTLFNREHHVICRERLAIRPLHALAQVKSELG